MNANELADELEKVGCTTYCRCEEAIPMLRQLQKQHDSLALWIKEYQDKVDELRAENAILRKAQEK